MRHFIAAVGVLILTLLCFPSVGHTPTGDIKAVEVRQPATAVASAEVPPSSEQANTLENEQVENNETPVDNEVIFEVTAYTADVESTQKRKGHPAYGITASGKRVQENHTVSCPKSLAYGTEIVIPSLSQTYVCEDRGSAITEGHLDIYMKNKSDAMNFGRQQLKIVIKGSSINE